MIQTTECLDSQARAVRAAIVNNGGFIVSSNMTATGWIFHWKVDPR